MGRLKKKKKKGEDGFTLLDVMITLVISIVAFSAVLGAISSVVTAMNKYKEKVITIIAQRNEDAKTREMLFTEK